MPGPLVSYVVIGRNEERHLAACLHAVRAQAYAGPREVLYVDSRSTDRSVAIAGAVPGVRVLVLDDPSPSAAKGRNAGWRAARGDLVQFVDGDAALAPEWTDQAVAALADANVAAVCGWLDERHPERSIYNRLADLDWPRGEGDVAAFGGIAMVRRRCLEESGGFPEDALSGEEPLLALALRRRGYRIVQLPLRMALHDVDLRDFKGYWRRCVATGISCAEQMRPARDLGAPLRALRTVKNLAFAGAAGVALAACVTLGFWACTTATALVALDAARIAARHRARAGSWTSALAYAGHVRLIIVAQLAGLCVWLRRRAFAKPRSVPRATTAANANTGFAHVGVAHPRVAHSDPEADAEVEAAERAAPARSVP